MNSFSVTYCSLNNNQNKAMLCRACKTFPVHRVVAFFHINVTIYSVQAEQQFKQFQGT